MIVKKTPGDSKKEKLDLERNVILRFLANQDYYKFKPGDILVKKEAEYQNDNTIKWVTEENWKSETPQKYVYAFENELGIGYVKVLKNDGSGPKGQALCMATFDPKHTRFTLDPGYADHLLVGEGEYKYNEDIERIISYRKEAIEKNKKLVIDTTTSVGAKRWWKSLKVGDLIYSDIDYSSTDEEEFAATLGIDVFKVLSMSKDRRWIEFEVIDSDFGSDNGEIFKMGRDEFFDDGCRIVSMAKPFPLKEDGF
jgi:hypothetical protein